MSAVQQQESTLIVGTITGTGNATVTVTKAGMTGTPLAITVALLQNDTPTQTAAKMATAMNLIANFAAVCHAYSVGATLYVLVLVAAANDDTMNVAYTNTSCTGLTADPTSDHFAIGNDGSIINGYATLAEFKAEFTILGTGDTNKDAARDGIINRIIQSVSRKIDDHCFRVFYGAAPATARYFTPKSPYRVFIDDATSITAIGIDLDGSRTYGTTLATTDYFAHPSDKLPITYIERQPLGNYNFPNARNSVKVTAVWGYNLTSDGAPGPVHEACLLQAYRIYERRKAPFGVTSVSELAPMTVIKLDVDVQDMLEPYIKGWGG